MICTLFRFVKAVPALIAGSAFFLFGCEAMGPLVRPPVEEPGRDLFIRAEAYRHAGAYEEALAAYEAYLETTPGGAEVPSALAGMGAIHSQRGRYVKAIDLYERIVEVYPRYGRLPEVRVQIIRLLLRLGRYPASRDRALEWLRDYPGSPLRREVFFLLGRNAEARKERVQALQWWLQAQKVPTGDPQREAELRAGMDRVIAAGSEEELARMASLAPRGLLAAKIYHRLASLFLEAGALERAEAATRDLLRAAREEPWISQGRHLLARVQAERSVRRGVVGCLLPLSGPFAVYGEEALNGIQLGMDIFSGQREQPVRELVVMDTAGDPARAVAALETMVREERVMTVIGPLSSRAAAAVAQRAEELGVPIIALTQKEGITEGKEMVFRNFLTPHREVDRVLEVALEAMGLKRYAILYPENSYGRHFMNLFWERLEKRGGVVTAVESYDPDETDFAEEIKKMIGTYYPRPASLTERRRNERPPEEEENRLNMEEPEPIVDFDAVFIPDSYTRVAMIAPQLVYHDVVDVQLLGSSLWQSPQLLEMSREYVQGALFPSGFHESSGMPGIRGFIETYTASFESPPGILAASGYDTVRFLEQVMSGQGVRTRSQLQKAILWSQGFDGVTGRIFFSFGGEVEKDPILLTVLGKRISMYR